MLRMPSNPEVGDQFTHGTDTWTFNGVGWSKDDKIIEEVKFTANKPLEVEEFYDSEGRRVVYSFNTEVIKRSSELVELECKIKTDENGNRYYTFHESHTDPANVFVYFTRGYRYIITQPMDEYISDPLTFYEDGRGSLIFERRPYEYIYEDGIIRDKNVISFRIKPEVPDVLVYGVESNTLMGEIRMISSTKVLSDPDPDTSVRPQDTY